MRKTTFADPARCRERSSVSQQVTVGRPPQRHFLRALLLARKMEARWRAKQNLPHQTATVSQASAETPDTAATGFGSS